MQLQTKIQPWFEAYDTMVLKALKKRNKNTYHQVSKSHMFLMFSWWNSVKSHLFGGEIHWNPVTCMFPHTTTFAGHPEAMPTSNVAVLETRENAPSWLDCPCIVHDAEKSWDAPSPEKIYRHFSVGNVSKKKSENFQIFFAKKFAPPFKKTHTHPWGDQVSPWDLVINSSRIMASSTLLRDLGWNRWKHRFPVVDRQITANLPIFVFRIQSSLNVVIISPWLQKIEMSCSSFFCWLSTLYQLVLINLQNRSTHCYLPNLGRQ